MTVASALVSVIIPTYNRAHLVDQAIQSVLDQTYQDFEIVVVDDGSTDNTREVISWYVQQYPEKVKYVFQPNAGCASARNAGLRVATGDYISFLDTDDLFEPRKLEVQLEVLQSHDCQFVYSPSIEFDESGHVWIGGVAAAGCPEDFAIEHFMTAAARPGAILYKKECIQRVGGFDETLHFNEDSDFLQKVAIDFRGCYSDYPSVRVRHHPGSKSRNRVAIYRALLKSTENILQDFPEFRARVGESRIERRLTEIRLLLANHLVLSGSYAQASQVLEPVNPAVGQLCRLAAKHQMPWLLKLHDRLHGRAVRFLGFLRMVNCV